MKYSLFFSAMFATAALMACSNGTMASTSPTAPTTVAATAPAPAPTPTPEPTPTPTPTTSGAQAVYAQFTNGVTVSFEGSTVVLKTTDMPDHKSPYFGAGNSMYEAPQSGMQVNPNRIASQNITFRVPVSPASATASDTPLGPIGIAVNGVVFYNQYAAMRQPLTTEIISFDRYNGHPNQQNQYHYHFEPVSITASSKSRLIGVLLDGFPVYGPTEKDGSAPSGLDSCHGHVGATAEFASGIYHYHTSTDVPYISGCFRGAAGSVSQ